MSLAIIYVIKAPSIKESGLTICDSGSDGTNNMMTVNSGSTDGNPETIRDKKEEDKKEEDKKEVTIPSVNGSYPEQNPGVSISAISQDLRKYKITKVDAPATGSVALSFDEIQKMLAGLPQFQHLALGEVPRDGNCFFHALAAVINHNEVAVNQFMDSYNRLVAKQVPDSDGGAQPEPVSAPMIRQLIHGWLQWGGDTLPDYWSVLGTVITPASDHSLEQHHKNGFIRNMALLPHATNYYGWDGLLAVLQLATGIPINLLQIRHEGSQIISELFDVNVLQQMTGDLFSKLRANDSSLVRLPNDASLSGNQPDLHLVHSGGDHYYPALTMTPEPLPDIPGIKNSSVNHGQNPQVGLEDKVPAENCGPVGAIKRAENRVFSAEENISEEHAASDREGEPVVVAREPQLWVLEWSADGTPRVLACAGADYSGHGHEGAMLVDPERDDELLDTILREFTDITDWYPAIEPYKLKHRLPEGPGDNSDADACSVMHASPEQSKKKSTALDSIPKILPSLKALNPIKSFDEGLQRITVESTRNDNKKMSRRQTAETMFNNRFRSLHDMYQKNYEEYLGLYLNERDKAIKNQNKTYYYNQNNGASLYNKAIDLLDDALFITESMTNFILDYRRLNFQQNTVVARSFSKKMLDQFCGICYDLVTFSNVFRYIIQSDSSVKFDSRFLKLQLLLVRLLSREKNKMEITSVMLDSYIYTMTLLFLRGNYSFADNKDEQYSCGAIMDLMYFVARVRKGYFLGMGEHSIPETPETPEKPETKVEIENKVYLDALQWHQEKVQSIHELKGNLKVALLLAGGNTLSPLEDQIVYGIQQKKKSRQGNVTTKKRGGRKKQPLSNKEKLVNEHRGKFLLVNKVCVGSEKFIPCIDQACQVLFTAPMDIDSDEVERFAHLKEVEELLFSNQDCLPGLKEVLAKFKERCGVFKCSLNELAKKQQENLRIEIERKRKSETERRQSKKHKKLLRSDTGHRKLSEEQATIKTCDAQNNRLNQGVSSSRNDPGEHAKGLSETEAVLMKAEEKMQSAMEFITQSENSENLPDKSDKKKRARKTYLKAIKILDDFLEKKDSRQPDSGKDQTGVDYDIALVLVTVSSWRIDYEYQFTDFFDQMYQAFDTACAWDNLLTMAMRQAVLPAYPKHTDLIVLIKKFHNIVSQLSDGECSNIARAVNEQNRALAILQSHCASGGGSEHLPYFDDQMDYLKKNQTFFDAIKTEYDQARRNALSAIASRRLIKRHLLPPNYYRKQGGKRTAPEYHPSELIEMLKRYDVKLENTFTKEVEDRKKRLTGLR